MEILSNNNIEIHRSQGGQPGNQNARKHGFYSRTLDEQGKKDFEEARDVLGLEDEIALLRAKIMGILRNQPNNVDVLNKAMATMCRLLDTQERVKKRNPGEGLKEAVVAALKGLALPASVAIGKLLGQ
jgi:hypothetical protein